jgi:uncharacterized iron-regulated membrane protein
MHWKKHAYCVHRWLALLVSLQLLAWSVGGFTFSILDLDDVHGDLDRNERLPPVLQIDRVQLTPAAALQRVADRIEAGSVARLSLRERLGRTVYELFDQSDAPLGAVDAESGEFIGRITQQQAEQIALDDFSHTATVRSATLFEEDPPLEFRGNPLPAYRVVLDHAKQPHIYVSAVTGDVVKRRNRPWRIFDFFWMLHIMDYGQRDDFNHPLLTAMSILAILTSASGLLLWAFLLKRRGRTGSESRFGTIQILKP